MSDLSSITARLEQVALRLEQAASRGQSLGSSAPTPTATSSANDSDDQSVAGFDELLSGPFADFVAKSKALGGDLATQIALVEAAFNAQRAFLVTASKAKQPSQDVLGKLLQPTSGPLGETQQFRESNRRSDMFNHLSAISEGIPCLGWVGVSPKPAPFIKEMKDAAQFYTNRVLKDFKGKDESHVDWAKSWIAVMDELYNFVKRVHTTGLVWNRNGVDASTLATATPAPATTSGPPPPPPMGAPPPPELDGPSSAPTKASSSDSDARASLFASLNQGGAITAKLKKVDKSQMTHKNPALRGSSVVPSSTPSSTAAPKKKPAYGAAAKKKDPVFELQGKKWVVEFQENNNDIVIDGNIKQTVYVYKCERSTIRVNGKINSIILDGCKKVGLAFDTAIAAIEVINSQSVQVQVIDKVPTVSIDKTDGCQVYLSASSLETEIVSAKSSEMNVLIPDGPDGDFKEMALPEQYKTVVKDGSLKTEPTDINA